MEHDFHRELKRQSADHFVANGWIVFQEFPLPDRTIADVFACRRTGEFVIAEISPMYSASKASRTFAKYNKWCNKLYLVSADEMQLAFGEGAKLKNWLNEQKTMGLLYITRGRLITMRPAIPHNLDGYTTNQLWDRSDRSLQLGEA